jgi:hypothetical protein
LGELSDSYDALEIDGHRLFRYDKSEHGAISHAAGRFLDDTLRELAREAPPDDLAPSLSTRYERLTIGAREGGERATVDLSVELRSMDDRSVGLRDGYALMETTSEAGGGRADELLRGAGCLPVSISKYRLGVGLLLAEDPKGAHDQALRSCFA